MCTPCLPMHLVSVGRPPAISDDLPVLAEVKAPRFVRPLRASALTSGCAPEVRAFIAGWSGVSMDLLPLARCGAGVGLRTGNVREEGWGKWWGPSVRNGVK
jgi:hypothetical protein